LPPGSRRLLGLVLEERSRLLAKAASGAARYGEHRLAVGTAQAARVRAAQEIGPVPARADLARWESCRQNLKLFCETYLASVFYLPWCADHLTVIARLQEVVFRGGLFAFAMPRGAGKTRLAEAAALWAVLYGHRRYVALLLVSAERGRELMEEHIKPLLGFRTEPPGPLTLDFAPELAPFLALEGEPRRCMGQRCAGRPTHVRWMQRRLAFGIVPGSLASGSIISAAGLTGGGVRGQSSRMPDSQRVIRPDLALIDDPQNDEVAASATQTKSRVRLLNGAVLGMAGPDRRIAALAAVTVIQPDDVASRLLDRQTSPDWRGERMCMLRGKAENPKLWEEYRELRLADLAGETDRAGDFYRARRAEMDAGLAATWPDRYDREAGEISAVQAAMNLKFRDEETFMAEYQNDPAPKEFRPGRLTTAAVMAKTGGRPRGEIPPAATHLTMFIDVHDRLLFYAVVAWEENFSGHVVDYGTFPDQGRRTYTLADAPKPLGRAYAGAGVNGAIQAGLEHLVSTSLALEWKRAGGGLMKIDRLLVDCGYKPALVAVVKQKVGGAATLLAKGMAIRGGRKPMAAWTRKPGEVHGDHWYIPTVRRTAEFPHVLVDVNYWKSFIHAGLQAAAGDAGSIALFGREPREHELFAEHLAGSEYWVEVTGPWGLVREWSLLPAKPDNHWLDCLVGCAAAASLAGVRPPGQRIAGARPGGGGPARPRKRTATYL
jgi:hypothetical protein